MIKKTVSEARPSSVCLIYILELEKNTARDVLAVAKVAKPRVLDVCPFQIRYFARITCGKILVDNFIIGAKV